MTDTATPDAELRRVDELSVELIDPDPDNVRRHLGDLTELAASIGSHGVLTPIIVFPDGDGRFGLVAGHRRFAAARIAELTTVPAIVDPSLTDARLRIEVQLIENLQRTDLDAVEEATGYFRLVNECEAKVASIAERVGRSASHVNKRLSLLELPATVLAKVKKGDATVEQALALRKLGERENIETVAKQSHPRDWQREVDKHRLEMEKAQNLAAAAEKLRNRRIDVVTTLDRETMKIVGREITFVVDGVELSGDAAVKAHKAEPCHTAWLHTGWGSAKVETSWVCVDPKRHLKAGDSPLKNAQYTRTDAEVNARRVAELAKQVRREEDLAVRSLGAGRLDRDTGKKLGVLAATFFIHEVLAYGDKRTLAKPLADTLEIEPVVIEAGEGTKAVSDYYAPLLEFAHRSDANLIRVGHVALLHLITTRYNLDELRTELLAGLALPPSPAAVELERLSKAQRSGTSRG